jgi:hypothetical protein
LQLLSNDPLLHDVTAGKRFTTTDHHTSMILARREAGLAIYGPTIHSSSSSAPST